MTWTYITSYTFPTSPLEVFVNKPKMTITTTKPSYLDRCTQKRADQYALIPPEWRIDPIPSVESEPNALLTLRNLLSPQELALTEETDIAVLLRRLSSGELSSLELTRAFAKRAALAHQLTTCCTEIFFEEAFAAASALDTHLATTGTTVGPLHGLPVSIKDLFSVKGVDTSIGGPSLLCQRIHGNISLPYILIPLQVGSVSPTTPNKRINPSLEHFADWALCSTSRPIYRSQ